MYLVKKSKKRKNREYWLKTILTMILLTIGFGFYVFSNKWIGIGLVSTSFIISLLIPRTFRNIKVYRKTKMMYDDGFTKFEPVNFAGIKEYKIKKKGRKTFVTLYGKDDKKMFKFSLEDENGQILFDQIEKYLEKKQNNS